MLTVVPSRIVSLWYQFGFSSFISQVVVITVTFESEFAHRPRHSAPGSLFVLSFSSFTVPFSYWKLGLVIINLNSVSQYLDCTIPKEQRPFVRELFAVETLSLVSIIDQILGHDLLLLVLELRPLWGVRTFNFNHNFAWIAVRADAGADCAYLFVVLLCQSFCLAVLLNRFNAGGDPGES